jgi:hypothetical protein
VLSAAVAFVGTPIVATTVSSGSSRVSIATVIVIVLSRLPAAIVRERLPAGR